MKKSAPYFGWCFVLKMEKHSVVISKGLRIKNVRAQNPDYGHRARLALPVRS
jgi:hypothetical protein